MIEINNIRKSYKMGNQTLDILKGIHLTIDDGDFVAIMGPSGSGKSTLMNILGLLDTPSEGSYKFNLVEVSKLNEDELALLRRNEIGFIIQQFHLLPRISALQNVALPLLYSKAFSKVERPLELLKKVSLSDRGHHRPNELSGGQQQRVAIARALVNNPKMILADEPTGNLDSQSEREIMNILKDLNSSGMTVVIVTHEESIGAQAKRLIRMRDGQILSDTRFTNEFSDPGKNLRRLTKAPTDSVTSNTLSSNSRLDLLNSLDYLNQGLKTLISNKVRTALSMLGILIGVAAVVAMLALGRGAQKAIEEQLASLGSNLLNIRPGNVRVAGVTQESGAANRLSYEDTAILQTQIKSIVEISAQVNSRAQTTAKGKNWNTQIQGTSAAWASMHSALPDIGRYFTEDENSKRTRVAVIGETIRRELFGDQIPIGEMIKLNRVNFQIIGILPEKGSNGFRDQDDVINIPVLTAMKRLMGRDNVELIETHIDKSENIEAAQASILGLLSSQHKIPLSQQAEAFTIRNMAEIQAALQSSSNTMSMLLAAIAAISLLVGGIGIMNIMLVSVTERTKEIGLRKAVGARRIDILAQFLSESVVISAVGGCCGVLLGWLITTLLSSLAGWATVISLDSTLLALGFSAFIGIVFGVYPARKAAHLNPIDALRFE